MYIYYIKVLSSYISNPNSSQLTLDLGVIVTMFTIKTLVSDLDQSSPTIPRTPPVPNQGNIKGRNGNTHIPYKIRGLTKYQTFI